MYHFSRTRCICECMHLLKVCYAWLQELDVKSSHDNVVNATTNWGDVYLARRTSQTAATIKHCLLYPVEPGLCMNVELTEALFYGYSWRQCLQRGRRHCQHAPVSYRPMCELFFTFLFTYLMSRFVRLSVTLVDSAGADLGFHKDGCPIHLKGAPEDERGWVLEEAIFVFLISKWWIFMEIGKWQDRYLGYTHKPIWMVVSFDPVILLRKTSEKCGAFYILSGMRPTARMLRYLISICWISWYFYTESFAVISGSWLMRQRHFDDASNAFVYARIQ